MLYFFIFQHPHMHCTYKTQTKFQEKGSTAFEILIYCTEKKSYTLNVKVPDKLEWGKNKIKLRVEKKNLKFKFCVKIQIMTQFSIGECPFLVILYSSVQVILLFYKIYIQIRSSLSEIKLRYFSWIFRICFILHCGISILSNPFSLLFFCRYLLLNEKIK